MNTRQLPAKWQSNIKAVKAVQVACDMDERVQKEIRKAAVEANLSPSDQIRMILGLPVNKKPKRPRLTVSLSPDDYLLLGEKYGIEPDSLIVEVTEEAIVHDIEQAATVLGKLKTMGCLTSLDDFGTGYSSLSHLQQLPVDELKIDRAFVMQVPDNKQSCAIVRSVIELAHNLGLEVVAEGVETTAALRWLRETGCERAQGFYLSKPMAAEMFVGWLQNWEKLAQEDAETCDPTDSLILRPRLIT